MKAKSISNKILVVVFVISSVLVLNGLSALSFPIAKTKYECDVDLSYLSVGGRGITTWGIPFKDKIYEVCTVESLRMNNKNFWLNQAIYSVVSLLIIKKLTSNKEQTEKRKL